MLYRLDTAAPSSSIPANTTRTSPQETDSAGVSVCKGKQFSEKDKKVKEKLEQLLANNPKALPIVIIEK